MTIEERNRISKELMALDREERSYLLYFITGWFLGDRTLQRADDFGRAFDQWKATGLRRTPPTADDHIEAAQRFINADTLTDGAPI